MRWGPSGNGLRPACERPVSRGDTGVTLEDPSAQEQGDGGKWAESRKKGVEFLSQIWTPDLNSLSPSLLGT